MEKKQQINLIQKLNTYNYKLYIPKEVEKKIDYTCRKIWDTEWSGALFFTYKGSFEENDLIIECKDIFIMDIGTHTYTEFSMNSDIISYMTENPELLDCQVGLIHSHCTFSTFFSSTDQQTLKEEGVDRNNFVSLIVNNAGTYTAAITRKVKRYSQVKEMLVYEFFGDGEKQDTREYTQDGIEEIEWFSLKIEKEENDIDFSNIEFRLNELKKNKAATNSQEAKSNITYKDVIPSFKSKDNKPIQRSLFEDYEDIEDFSYNSNKCKIETSKVEANKDVIKSLLLQLITGSILVSNRNKMDVVKWCETMTSLYEKRFGKGAEGKKNFEIWAETYIEYLLWYTPDDSLDILYLDELEVCAIKAQALIEELDKLPKNMYIKSYIKMLQDYLA